MYSNRRTAHLLRRQLKYSCNTDAASLMPLVLMTRLLHEGTTEGPEEDHRLPIGARSVMSPDRYTAASPGTDSVSLLQLFTICSGRPWPAPNGNRWADHRPARSALSPSDLGGVCEE